MQMSQPEAVKMVIALGVGMLLCIVAMVISLLKVRQRWREGQQALNSLRSEARQMNLGIEKAAASTLAAEEERSPQKETPGQD